ncbi:peroxidasin [Aphis craccivora]|uniref:Peroxidasin n=1 Tax=Aphis craccivora TaxID=307492 RepID=A0A6G0Z4J5_APHCR|nr:peroxidasin [Aphis craccivora]
MKISSRKNRVLTTQIALAPAPLGNWHVRLPTAQCAMRSVCTMTRLVYHVVSRRRVDAATAVFRKTMVGPMLLLVLLAFFLPSFPSAAAECPAKCMCFKTTVRCMFLHLDRIPDRISPTTTVLSLSIMYLIKVLRNMSVLNLTFKHSRTIFLSLTLIIVNCLYYSTTLCIAFITYLSNSITHIDFYILAFA